MLIISSVTLLIIPNPAHAVSVTNNVINIINGVVNKSPVTYSDSNYQNSTNKFSKGNVVYLKFNSNSDGSDLREAWLENSVKEKLEKINLDRIGNNPYIYVGKIVLPEKEGQYYLTVNIKGNGNNFSYSQNLEVISGNSTNNNHLKPAVSEEKNREDGVRSIIFNIFIRIIGYLKSFF